MAVTPPTRGQQDWDDEMNNALQSLDAAAQSAADNASAAVSTANTARDIAQSVHTAVIGTADAATAGFINTPASETATALSATYEAGAAKIVYVSPTGNDSASGKTMSAAKATITAALTEMGASRGTIVLDNGTIDAGAGVTWPATATCGMVGQGPGNTIIQATGQVGAVLDLTDVGYGLQDSEFGSFSIHGDGTAGAAKKGLELSPTVSLVRGYLHDITVKNTGGACFDLGYAELTDFDRLIAYEPVSAAANDIPYLIGTGAFNGNRINGLQLHGTSEGANVGASGAVVIKDNGSTAPHDNHIATPRVEYLHVPTDGTLFAIAGNGHVVSDIQMFDSGKVSGATGTSHVRLTDPSGTAQKLGGNLVTGIIPGKGTNATDLDCGVDIRQSRNAVVGVKGYRGTNVILAAGVGNCHIELQAAVSGATDAAVTDSSDVTTNTIIDRYLNTVKRPATTYSQGAASYKVEAPGSAWSGGVRFSDPTTPANGLIGLGTSGVRMQAAGANAFYTGDQHLFRKVDLSPAPVVLGGSLTTSVSWRSGSGSPEGAITAAVGSLYSRTDGGAATTLYVKESGTGNTGWVAK